MKITDIKIRKLLDSGKLRGVVSITLDDAFAVHDIKVIQGENRLFVAMPSRRDEKGTFRDVVHPINSELRTEFESQILSTYQKELDNQLAEQQKNNPSNLA